MAKNISEIKKRIALINSINKITRAMELVATAKLQKLKKEVNQKKVYFQFSYEVIRKIFSKIPIHELKTESNIIFSPQSKKKLFIIVSSNLGFCGGYNNNLFKKILKEFDKSEDACVTIGKKGKSFTHANQIKLLEDISIYSDYYTFENIRSLTSNIMTLLNNGEYGELFCCYTKFVNSITFTPTIVKLLPINVETLKQDITKTKSEEAIYEFEPDVNNIIDQLIPMYLESTLYGFAKESQLSEQASRRISMENATDNANEIIEKLELEYNRERQSKITTEISEIVAGAEALS